MNLNYTINNIVFSQMINFKLLESCSKWRKIKWVQLPKQSFEWINICYFWEWVYL